jgi:hypothetical protein
VRHTYYRTGPIPPTPVLLTREVVEQYLNELHVKYVIGFADTDEGTLRKLEAAGFREEMAAGEFVLWSRSENR